MANREVREKQKIKIDLYQEYIQKYIISLPDEIKTDTSLSYLIPKQKSDRGIGGTIASIIPSLGPIFGAIIGGHLGALFGPNEDEIDQNINNNLDSISTEISNQIKQTLEAKVEKTTDNEIHEMDELVINNVLSFQEELFRYIRKQSSFISKIEDQSLAIELKNELIYINESYLKINTILINSILNKNTSDAKSDFQLIVSKVENCILQGKTKDALEVSLNYYKRESNNECVSSTILLLNQYKILKLNSIQRTISNEEYMRGVTNINKSVLELIQIGRIS